MLTINPIHSFSSNSCKKLKSSKQITFKQKPTIIASPKSMAKIADIHGALLDAKEKLAATVVKTGDYEISHRYPLMIQPLLKKFDAISEILVRANEMGDKNWLRITINKFRAKESLGFEVNVGKESGSEYGELRNFCWQREGNSIKYNESSFDNIISAYL